MNCKKCGAVLAEGDRFCMNCGENVSTPLNQEQGSVLNGSPQNVSEQNVNASMNYSNNMGNNQPGGGSYNNMPVNNQPTMNKNNGNGKYVVIGLGIVCVLIVAIFAISKVFSKDDTGSLTGSGSSGVIQTSNRSNYKVMFEGFSFEIPDDMVYEVNDDILLIGDEEGTWAVQVYLLEGSFSQIKGNIGQLQSNMNNAGYVASSASLKNVGGVEFITLEATLGGDNAILAFARANSMYVVGLAAMNLDNEFDYQILEKVASVVRSVNYTGNASNSIKGAKEFKLDAVEDLAK